MRAGWGRRVGGEAISCEKTQRGEMLVGGLVGKDTWDTSARNVLRRNSARIRPYMPGRDTLRKQVHTLQLFATKPNCRIVDGSSITLRYTS